MSSRMESSTIVH